VGAPIALGHEQLLGACVDLTSFQRPDDAHAAGSAQPFSTTKQGFAMAEPRCALRIIDPPAALSAGLLPPMWKDAASLRALPTALDHSTGEGERARLALGAGHPERTGGRP
jgi:hypothetical protein